jgi:hypothetical protein
MAAAVVHMLDSDQQCAIFCLLVFNHQLLITRNEKRSNQRINAERPQS